MLRDPVFGGESGLRLPAFQLHTLVSRSARRTLQTWFINRNTMRATKRCSGREETLYDFVVHDFVTLLRLSERS